MKTFLSVLVSIFVAARHGVPTTDEDVARYREVAETVVRESARRPLWGDPVELEEDAPPPAHVAATATLLWAIAFHESGLRQEVRRCRVAGDQGRSFGIYQLQRGWSWQGRSKEDICESDALQTQLALGVLHRYRTMSPSASPIFWLNGYASGNGGYGTRESAGLRRLWEHFSRQAGLMVSASPPLPPRWKQGAAATLPMPLTVRQEPALAPFLGGDWLERRLFGTVCIRRFEGPHCRRLKRSVADLVRCKAV